MTHGINVEDNPTLEQLQDRMVGKLVRGTLRGPRGASFVGIVHSVRNYYLEKPSLYRDSSAPENEQWAVRIRTKGCAGHYVYDEDRIWHMLTWEVAE